MTKQITELQRIAALPYNPYFQKGIDNIRSKYNLQEEQKVVAWFIGERNKYGKNAYSNATNNLEITDTDIPIERDIFELLHQFSLPNNLFSNTLIYILTEDKAYVTPKMMKPTVSTEDTLERGTMEFKVQVNRLGVFTTKEQWDEIWNIHIRPKIESIKSTRFIVSTGRKRASLKSYQEQMKRYSEWYELSEKQGLGSTKALEKWEKQHPTEPVKYDVSTVSKAVKEFRQIITPINP